MKPRSPLVVVASCAAAIVLVVAPASPVAAGTVGGKIDLVGGPPARTGVRARGFLDRIENPHLPVRPVDPNPSIVIVLEGPGAAAAPAPVAVTWELVGDSFARHVLPVRVGGEVVIRNKGRGAPVLVATGLPDLLAKKPLNPTAEVHFMAKTAGVIELIDQATPHLRGRVLVVASPYFAVPDARGGFEIPDVPAGEWTVRVWYDRGWVDRVDDKITVGGKRTEINPKLPSGLPIKP